CYLVGCRDCICRFFFQAEDGIRDFHVTGVQTCALPILDKRGRRWTMWARDVLPHLPTTDPLYQAIPFYLVWKEGRVHGFFLENRSEERRVGKECRSWWSPEH